MQINDYWSKFAKQKYNNNSSLTVYHLPFKQNVVGSTLIVRSIVLRRRPAEMGVAGPDLAKQSANAAMSYPLAFRGGT